MASNSDDHIPPGGQPETSKETTLDTTTSSQEQANILALVDCLVTIPMRTEHDTNNSPEVKKEPMDLTKFTIFKEFPPEIRAMVWRDALDEAPKVVEAVYNSTSGYFELCDSTADNVLAVCGLRFLPKYFKPIYLFAKTTRRGRGVPTVITRHGLPPASYIRPAEDILYIARPFPNLDSSQFVSRPENQAIQHLAMTWSNAETLARNAVANMDAFSGTNLVSKMKLRSVYIVEGECYQDEAARDLERHSLIKLVDVPEGRTQLRWYIDSDGVRHLNASPWNSGELDAMKAKINRNFQRVGLWELTPSWDAPPEIIGKVIQRTVIGQGEEITAETG